MASLLNSLPDMPFIVAIQFAEQNAPMPCIKSVHEPIGNKQLAEAGASA